MKKHVSRILTCLGIAVISITASSCATQKPTEEVKSSPAIPRVAAPEKQTADADALIWRFIGPMTGTRGSVVLGHPTDKNVFYHGASGGLWKTPDAGQTWVPVGDGQFKSSSVGAMDISASNPNVMYVGMGEPQMRNNVSWGDGVYKSVDGGATWTHLGLEDTHHIAQVRIHPTANPDIVYVAAYGHAFGPNPRRGVFRTRDGGQSWEKVLYKSETAGAIDLVLNPPIRMKCSLPSGSLNGKPGGRKQVAQKVACGNPLMVATTGQRSPKTRVCRKAGWGRIGMTMSAADADRVYALIDSETKPALYRSDDRGENWSLCFRQFPDHWPAFLLQPHYCKSIQCRRALGAQIIAFFHRETVAKPGWWSRVSKMTSMTSGLTR